MPIKRSLRGPPTLFFSATMLCALMVGVVNSAESSRESRVVVERKRAIVIGREDVVVVARRGR